MIVEQEGIKPLMSALDIALQTIDQDGQPQPSIQLLEAMAKLNKYELSLLKTAIAITRGAAARMRPVPKEQVVGKQMAMVLEKLASTPNELLLVLEFGLLRGTEE